MNIFNKVSLQSMLKNKTRTIVTIIGIMLSTALICSVTTSFATIRQYAINYYEFIEGKWHGMEENVSGEVYDIIENSDIIKDKCILSYIGYADVGSSNDFKPYLYISGFDEDEKGIAPIHITSGRLPQNKNEILLPDHLYENGNVNYKTGDVITLNIGDRKLKKEIPADLMTNNSVLSDFNIDEADLDFILRQDSPLIASEDDDGKVLTAEYIDVRETHEYTVVGIYERPEFEEYFSPGYTALTVPDEYTENTQFTIFYRMNRIDDIYSFLKDNNLESRVHTNLLMFKGISRYETFYGVVYGLISIVIGLIMFGSIMLIYNAFSISVSERTKQFGLLSSIGATKKQLKKMVRYEAVALSAIGIPLGILLGIAGMWVTFLAIGSRFTFFIGNRYNVPMRVCISPTAIAAACIIAFVTIIISAWIPSRRATRISAVEAIRQNSDIKQKKNIRTPKIIYKIFGLPGMLAHKYFKRSKKKYRATIISLFMSIVLFISAYSFTVYLVSAINDTYSTYGMDYIYSMYDTDEKHEEKYYNDLLDKIRSTEYITDAAFTFQDYCFVYVKESDIREESNNDSVFFLYDEMNSFPTVEGCKSMYSCLYFIDDEHFKELLKKYGLSEKEFMDSESPLGIAFDNILSFDRETGRTIRKKAFNKDDFHLNIKKVNEIDGYYFSYVNEDGKAVFNSINELNSKEVPLEESFKDIDIHIGKVIDERPFFISDNETILIYPYSNIEYVLGQETVYNSTKYKYSINSSDIKGGYEKLKTLFKNEGLSKNSFINYAEGVESNRSVVIIIKVFAYGFIILISLIAAANVFNTITTNINLRRRDFAMLKSVGMTDKAMRKMLNFECILYGTKALIYGLPVSAGVTYLIYCSIRQGIDTNFFIPWEAVGIAVLSVFIVVFATMMFSMSKIKNDNPIDALKNENL